MKAYFRVLGWTVCMVVTACHKDKGNNVEQPKKAMVSTIAGGDSIGFSDGSVLSARFNYPFDLAVDADGSMYVMDAGNFRIRKILSGQVFTFAGNDSELVVNGRGAAASFKLPVRVAIDLKGNLFVTDLEDPRIRRISAGTDVITYAGTSIAGFADGGVGVAQFGSVAGIVTDRQGNVFVTDAGNARIRKISIAGQVTTIAGNGLTGFLDGEGGVAQFKNPGGIVIDPQNNLYVADGGNFRIRKITPDGVVSTFAGSGLRGSADGASKIAQFSDLGDMVIDKQGNLFVSDSSRIRRVSAQGVVSTVAGTEYGFADGDGASAKFYIPNGLGIDAQGNIYVADTYNNRIRKISFY